MGAENFGSRLGREKRTARDGTEQSPGPGVRLGAGGESFGAYRFRGISLREDEVSARVSFAISGTGAVLVAVFFSRSLFSSS